MSVWGTVTWDVARAGGFTAYILVTLAVALGLALTLHWQSPHRWPRLINTELHNFLTLLSLVFTGVHVLAVWLDPFTRFGWNEIFIPLASHYRPLWMALGIVALYLGIAIGISTWLRPLIGYRWWRRLHTMTLLAFALVTVHGIATGSDTRTWWGVAIYASSVLLVGVLLWRRLSAPATAQSRAHPVLAAGVGLLVLAGAIWTALGPLQPGWNAIANSGHGSGARIALATSPQSPAAASPAFTSPFTAALQGTLTQTGPDANGNVTLQLDTTLSQGAQGTLQVVLQGQMLGGDDGGARLNITASQVTLSASTGDPRYTGSLTSISGGRRWHMGALLTGAGASGSQVQVQMDLQIDSAGQVNGTVAGTPTAGNGA
jgi:hypothetical protein